MRPVRRVCEEGNFRRRAVSVLSLTIGGDGRDSPPGRAVHQVVHHDQLPYRDAGIQG